LHQRGNPAGEQVGADQEGDILRRQFKRPADDQRHRDRAGIHHQHMLQSQRQKAGYRQALVDGMNFAAHDAPSWGLQPRSSRYKGHAKTCPVA
jgi:hypothetical protein